MTSLKLKWIYLPLLLFILLFQNALSWGSQDSDAGYIGKLKGRIAQNPGDITSRFELAEIYYDLAGLNEYFAERSLLWNESDLDRRILVKKLPSVSSEYSKECQAQLIQILALNSLSASDGSAINDPNVVTDVNIKNYVTENIDILASTFIMCADYHLIFGQKEAALWYYSEAKRVAPGSRKVLLALADLYLFERQPDKVLKLLEGQDGPDAALLRGEAYLQQGELQYALGYFLQAAPLPGNLQPVREKDLYILYLKLGDFDRARALAAEFSLRKDRNTASAIYPLIYQELDNLMTQTKSNTGVTNPPDNHGAVLLTENGLLVKLPAPGKLVAEIYHEAQDAMSYIGEQYLNELLIPNDLLRTGNEKLRLWYKGEAAKWEMFETSVNVPKQENKKPLLGQIACDNAIINKRKVRLRLNVESSFNNLLKMAVAEEGETADWIPFSKFYDYHLSEGDGEKKILARFQDQYANTGESELLLTLDTTPPELTALDVFESESGYLHLTWKTRENVTSTIRLFTKQGDWEEIPIPTDADGQFKFSFPIITNTFCQVVLNDQAGNKSIFPVNEANRILADSSDIPFSVNNSLNSSLKMVEITPELGNEAVDKTDTADNTSDKANRAFYWAVSNDLVIWSGWRQGNAPLKWRLETGEGEKLIYIKYKITDEAHTSVDIMKYYVISIPPE